MYNKISGRELPSQVHVELKKVQRHLAQHFAVDCSANFEAFRVRPKKLTGLKNEETENESINNVNATMDPRKLLLHIICLENWSARDSRGTRKMIFVSKGPLPRESIF